MDVQMPEMDACKLTAAIRKKKESTGGHVAIVAIRRHARPSGAVPASRDGRLHLYAGLEPGAHRQSRREYLPHPETRLAALPAQGIH